MTKHRDEINFQLNNTFNNPETNLIIKDNQL